MLRLLQNDFILASKTSHLSSLYCWMHTLVDETRCIALKISWDLDFKAWHRWSVIYIVSFIRCKMNTNSNEVITWWTESPSARWEEVVHISMSLTITSQAGLKILIKLETDLKWELQRVSVARCKVLIWLSPLPVSISSISIMYAFSAAWAARNSSNQLHKAQTILTIELKLVKNWWTKIISFYATTNANCKRCAK